MVRILNYLNGLLYCTLLPGELIVPRHHYRTVTSGSMAVAVVSH